MTGLRSDLIVGGLLRAAEASGGNGAILARGDAASGAISILLSCRGSYVAMLDRVSSLTRSFTWNRRNLGESSSYEKVAQLIAEKKRFDGDIWIVELDVADVEQFIVDSLPET